ncbi:vacuolar assembling protein VPS41 [Pleurotus eryngii]|uniref:Vacuolar protein sorting-associated protein 41 n=1 Tax=Pleurotus eryngii TaxID=5323 RepID=A0A9P6A703_PLEER|nr:vacuolar assembling protein VPS41 [Pleurotus eryngii]
MASSTSQDSVGDAEKGPARVLTASPTQFTDSESEPAANDSVPRAGSDPEGTNEGESYDGSDGEEEEDDYEDDDEDDDEEPALKYERIGGSVPDLFGKDSASSLAVANKLMALGTHNGIVHILDLSGNRIKSYKPHMASVVDICMDSLAEFVATASIDGQVVIHSLSSKESYAFDMKRPMRTIALEPNFSKSSYRSFVCGGLAGTLVLHEKGWLGHKETVLHSGEGPIGQVRWRGRLIAWANDLGVKIYDTMSQTRITFIDRPADSPRADLFKCTLHWQDDSTLIIAWADYIKVARVRARPPTNDASSKAGLPPLIVEITAALQLECMISGIVPHEVLQTAPAALPELGTDKLTVHRSMSLTSFLILAYTPPDTSFTDEMTEDRAQQAKKAAERPELQIISRTGEELATDALTVSDYHRWGCNDYVLADVLDTANPTADVGVGKSYVVMSPKDIVLVKPRDRRDHVAWLVERKRYEEALEAVERIEASGEAITGKVEDAVTTSSIGQRYIEHLMHEGEFTKAAKLCPKVCGQDVQRWENWILLFADKEELQAIIPYVPTDSPRLSHLVYEMMLAYFIKHDRQALLQTVRDWPKDIYNLTAVIVAIHSELDSSASTSTFKSSTQETTLLMECLAELYTANRQPGKALPFYLRLRRPNVFDLIREHNLFTDVRDQALLLVEFDQELVEQRRKNGEIVNDKESPAITLLVDHIHSIPIGRVVQQLQSRPYYLFLYLDALFEKDPYLTADFADIQVKLYAEYATLRLIDFLRASNYYNLENAYNICKGRDLVTEMVFLLGRMGNNKQALTLIIERLGDVNRAIDFAKEQADDDLWEDLLKYSETRPTFIRGLLENVGAEIDPIRLIRRIKNGLEIPGLKDALIKILHDFHLQISLLEGCQTILNGDSSDLAGKLHRYQNSGFFLAGKTTCPICSRSLHGPPQELLLLFLCRHAVHASCVEGGDDLPSHSELGIRNLSLNGSIDRIISNKLTFASSVRAQVRQGCPVCRSKSEGKRA